MKLTETQKKFKQQMKGIKSQSSPYDNSRGGNPFHRQKVSVISIFILIVVLAFAVTKYSGRSLNSQNATFGLTPQVAAVDGTQDAVGAIPRQEAEALKRLFVCEQEMGLHWSEVTKYHKIPWEKRNLSAYKQALLDGITACDKWLIKLESITDSGDIEPLYLVEKDIVTNSNLSFKYYLNYLSSKNPSDIEVGNNYLKLVNKSIEQRKLKFIEILDQKGYRYEIQDDGSTKYWVSQK